MSSCNPLSSNLGNASNIPPDHRPGIPDSPKDTPVEVSAELSTLSLSSTSIVADGGVSSAVVTATLLDTKLNPVAGKIVSLSSSRGSTTDLITAVSATTNDQGEASFTISSATSGVSVLTATDVTDSIVLVPTVSLTFTPSLVSIVKSTITASGSGIADGLTPLTITITLLDEFSNPVSGLSPTFSATDTGTTNAYGACSISDTSGVSTCTLTSTKAELKTLTITSPILKTDGSANFVAGAASQLVFATDPGAGTASAAWSTQPIVEIRDAQGNLVTTGADATRTITVALTTGTGTLTGTLTKTAVGGVADFSANALKIDLIGTDKVLTASTSITAGAVSITSSAFTIAAAAASQLVFTTGPGGGTAGSAWSTQPIVQIQDAQGNLVTTGADATRTITVALTTGTGTLSGTLTKTAVGGIADFSANALLINLIGTNKVLTASTTITAGAVSIASSSFTITHAAATQLAFSTQPGDGTSSVAWTTQPIVEVRDTYGNLVTTGADSTRTITVALTTGTGTLTGTLTKAAVAGVADFSANALKIDLAGTNKVLTASTTITAGAVSIASSAFTIAAAGATQLVFATGPGGGVAGAAWSTQPIVEIRDAQGNLVTTGADATRTITVALTTGTGTLTGTLTKTAVGGVADFSANALKINLVGTDKIITASATITAGAVSVASSAFTITFAAASQIVVTTQPSSSTVALIPFATQPIVTIEDAFGNTVTSGADSTRTITLALQTGTGSLAGTALTKAAVGGVADFVGKGLNVDLIGTNKVIRASTTITAGAVTVDTSAFTITHGSASVVVITTQPGGGTAGSAWSTQPVAEIRDAFGNLVSTGVDSTATVTATLTTGTGALSGTVAKAAVGGVVTYTNLSIQLTGTNKVLTLTKADTTGSAGTVSANTTSSSFTITNAPATALVFTTQPGGGTAATAWGTQPIVELRDTYGNTVSSGADSTVTVSVALTTGTGTLTGTNTKAAIAGVSDFAGLGLKINLIGSDKVLTASTTVAGGSISVASSAFTVTHGTASQIAFSTEPGGGTTGSVWSQQPVVVIRDAQGNRVSTGADSTVTIAVALSTGSGSVAGTTSKAAVAGVATFTNLYKNLQGTADKITASTTIAAGAVTKVSAGFDITLGAALTAASWTFDALDDATYVPSPLSTNHIDLTGGVARLTAATQTDNSTYGFGGSDGGSFTGGATWDSTNGVRVTTTSPDLELSSSWTPAYSNIVGYWKLNGTVGAIGSGASANNITATVGSAGSSSNPNNAGMAYATAQLQQGITLDGADDNLSFSHANTPEFTSSYTISLWVYFSSNPANSATILSRGYDGSNIPYFIDFQTPAASRVLSFGSFNGTNYRVYSNTLTASLVGQWNHIVGVRSGNTYNLYINGVLDNSAAFGAHAFFSNANGFNVGCLNLNGSLQRFFGGTVDDIAMWNTDLSASAVQMIYQHQAAKYTGTFTSRVMDAFSTGQSWTNLAWTPTLPFYKALPDAGTSESQANYASLYSGTLMTGIVGLWHLDEAGGATSIVDSSGQATPNTGTPTSVTSGAVGKFNSAASFNSTSSYISIPDSASLHPTTGITISAWIYRNPGDSNAVYRGILSKYSTSTLGPAYFFRILSGKLVFYQGTGATNLTGTHNVSSGEWHHVLAKYDTTTQARVIYLDGVVEASDTSAVAFTYGGASALQIGLDYTVAGARFFNGSIDEVAMWNRALDPAEVLQLYRRGANRMKYQMRSCSDSACTTGSPPWLGPDGTNQSYFSELYNTASNSLTGAVSNGLPTMTFSNFGSLTVAANRYFQYRAIMESDDANTLCTYSGVAGPCSPELKVATAGPTHYDSSAPYIGNATGIPFHYLTGISDAVGAGGCTNDGTSANAVKYVISSDNSTWYYWTGAAWATSNSSYAQANSAATLTAGVLNAFVATGGTGNLYYKALLKSDGTHACEINSLSFSGNQ